MKILVILLAAVLLPHYAFGMEQQNRKMYKREELEAYKDKADLSIIAQINDTSCPMINFKTLLFGLVENDRNNSTFARFAKQHAGELSSLRLNKQTLEQHAQQFQAVKNLQTLRNIISDNQNS